MTVSYNLDVSSVNSFTFLKLLGKWRGSIFKSVYLELIGWIIAYYIVHCVYRFCLPENGQRLFERIAGHLDNRLVYIPLTFMLGFFVTIVIDRWRNILSNMAFIEGVALVVNSYVRGAEEEPRLIRRSVIRYLVLSQVLVFRDISMRVRRRFPNMESLIDAGFILKNELEIMKNFQFDYNKYWIPINWATTLLNRCWFDEKEQLQRKYIDSAPLLNQMNTEVRVFRDHLDMMSKYDWVPIPIAYPQVVFLAVRVYFVICLFSRQFMIEVDESRNQMNLVFPLMTVLEFLFFVGWMKVAEALLNPLGEDDDDLECNWLIDKNIAIGMAIVDEHHDIAPNLEMDLFLNPTWRPVYSAESANEANANNCAGSAACVELLREDEKVQMVHVEPQNEVIHKTSSTGLIRRKITAVFTGGDLEQRRHSTTISPKSPGIKRGESFPFPATNLERLDEESSDGLKESSARKTGVPKTSRDEE